MKELDVVLSGYLESRYESAPAAEQDGFRELLQLPDPQLYRLLLGRDDAIDPERRRLVETLRKLKGSS